MPVSAARLLALLLLALRAAGLRITGAQRGRGLPQESLDCLRGKTVYLAGNSVTRGLFYTLIALVEDGDDFNSSTAFWRDRSAQKEACMMGPLGFMSCHYYLQALNTRLVMSMTQRLDEFEEQLKKASKKFKPDVVVVEIGLDHTTHEYEVDGKGAFSFERSLDREFASVAERMEQAHADHHTRFLWRAVSHFNEKSAWHKEWTNSNVDLWNRELYEHFQARNYVEAEWFRWYTGSAHIVDQALAAKDGYAMEDWVHPDSDTMAQLTRDLVPNLCF